MIDYDPRIDSLIHPEHLETVFRAGQACSPRQVGAGMAHLAYYHYDAASIARLTDALRLAGFGEAQTFDGSLDTQAFAARRGDGLTVVAFRGTQPDSIADIGVDATIPLVGWEGAGRIHQGFRDSFNDVRLPIEQWMRGAGVTADTPLLVCGHSLGAALATVAGAAWTQARIVTLGSPRVGDATFAASVSGARCERIVDCCDLVARVPPRELGYDHVDATWFIGADGTLVPDPGAAAIDAQRHIARGQYFANYVGLANAPVRDLADHCVMNYLRACF